MQQNRSRLQIVLRRRHALIQPTDLLTAAEPQRPTGADAPASDDGAVPLWETTHEVADRVPFFLVEDRALLAPGQETREVERGMGRTGPAGLAPRAPRFVGIEP